MLPHVLAVVAQADAAAIPPAWRFLSKFGYFLGLFALVGSCFTHVVVVRPALRRYADDTTLVAANRLMHRLIGIGAAAFVALFVVQFVAGVAKQSDLSFAGALHVGLLRDALTAPADDGAWISAGALTVVQIVMVLATAALLVPLVRRPNAAGADRRVLLATPLALVVHLVEAVPTSRAALAFDEVVDSLLDQTHVLAGGIWVGGLAALALLTVGREQLALATADAWAAIWRRFSLIASICVGAVSVSGLWLAWKHVGTVGQLFTTTYGELLGVKLLIVATLVGFGAYNQMVLMPRIERLRRAGHHEPAVRLAVRHFGKVVRTEALLGAVVLLIVGMLSGSARKEAGSPDAVTSAAIWGWGIGFTVLVVALFLLTARLATFLASRPLGDDSVTLAA